MTKEDQSIVCKTVIKACMWGHGGIASVIMDNLQRDCPTEPPWDDIRRSLEKESRYEAVGSLRTEEEVRPYLAAGYIICNYEPGELSVHYPSRRGGGLCTYIVGPLADALAPLYDAHNYRVYQKRKENGSIY
jgi:hypothetical protein